MAWYNKYRPATFHQTVGQNLVKKVLQNTVISLTTQQPKLKHAYLLSGPRGTGKTSLARIFAKAINCQSQNVGTEAGESCGECQACQNGQIDIVELDAASNTGVDNIRDLLDAAATPPFVSRYKVYIIDEVHMLSKSAMNAMLKTLEEPPDYLVFLLATTEPEKIIETVMSRVTWLKLTNLSAEQISPLLAKIAEQEKLSIEPKALELLAKRAQGGLRDAINLLETISSYNLENFTEADVATILGLLPETQLEKLIERLLTGPLTDLKPSISDFENLGVDPKALLSQLLEYLLDRSLDDFLHQTAEPTSSKENLLRPKKLIDNIVGLLSGNLALDSVRTTLTLLKINLIESRHTSQANSESTTGQRPDLGQIPSDKPLVKPNNLVDLVDLVDQAKFSESDDKLPQLLADQPNTTIPTEAQIAKSDLLDKLKAELHTEGFPMLLKTFFNSLQAFISKDQFLIFLPNKTFILPLKSTKIQTWFQTKLAEHYPDQSFKLEIVTPDDRAFELLKSLVEFQSPPTVSENNNPNNNPNGSTESKLPTEQLADENEDENFTLSDFYYLYAPLPDGTVPEGMKLYDPNSKLTKPSDVWGTHLDDLELE